MKTLEELKEMRKNYLKGYEGDEYLQKLEKCNFLAYNVESDSVVLYDTYAAAKNYAEMGGQVLVLDKDKIYTYKVKSFDKYVNYVGNQIKQNNYNKMNKYGL